MHCKYISSMEMHNIYYFLNWRFVDVVAEGLKRSTPGMGVMSSNPGACTWSRKPKSCEEKGLSGFRKLAQALLSLKSAQTTTKISKTCCQVLYAGTYNMGLCCIVWLINSIDKVEVWFKVFYAHTNITQDNGKPKIQKKNYMRYQLLMFSFF